MSEESGFSHAQSAWVGFGSNLGDRESNIQRALDDIASIPGTRVCERSGFFEFPAAEVREEQPDYINGVLRLETELGPLDLLEKLQIIERKLGRSFKGDHSARPIDLDLLSYGEDVVITGKTLILPHPRMHERRFVLEPLIEICPEWFHPRLKKTARQLLADLAEHYADHPVNPNT